MLRLNMSWLKRKARSQGDSTVEDIARRTGIHKATLHRLAAGDGEPSLRTVWKLREVYGGRVESLISDDSPAGVPAQRTAPPRHQRAT
ncbi:helix-turn-helix domain-containing protein [Streptomyces sp. NPDC091385]|uniref:helix-turn-helix domain-containing protein n=1 Tax=Streptomyces sp. NPDC091385 TaxID=3365997 RepID=UPI0038016313